MDLFDNYFDLDEAAKELRIHSQSLRRLIKQKKIKAITYCRKYLIERDVLMTFKATYNPKPGRRPNTARLF